MSGPPTAAPVAAPPEPGIPWRTHALLIVALLLLGQLILSAVLGADLELTADPHSGRIPVYTPALRREVKALRAAAGELRTAVQDALAVEAVWQAGDTSLTSPAMILQQVYGRYTNCQIWTLRLCQALNLSAQATFLAVASPDPAARARAEILLYTVRTEAVTAERRLLGHPQAAAAGLTAGGFRVPFPAPVLNAADPFGPAGPPVGDAGTGTSPADAARDRLLGGP